MSAKPKASSDLWAQLDGIRAQAAITPASDVPEGAFTANEYRDRYGLACTTANGQLRRLVRAGKLKEGKKMMADPRGHRCLVRCYWVP